MHQSNDAIETFFREFEQRSDSGDIPALLPQFADTFMAAGPQGTQCIRAADFAAALPRRKQFFDSLGCRSTSLVSLDHNRLDARYVLAKTRWRMTFVQGEGEVKEVLADSAYVVDTGTDTYKIVFYLAHQDIVQTLKDRGIAPA
jgi:hypothetical protein